MMIKYLLVVFVTWSLCNCLESACSENFNLIFPRISLHISIAQPCRGCNYGKDDFKKLTLQMKVEIGPESSAESQRILVNPSGFKACCSGGLTPKCVTLPLPSQGAYVFNVEIAEPLGHITEQFAWIQPNVENFTTSIDHAIGLTDVIVGYQDPHEALPALRLRVEESTHLKVPIGHDQTFWRLPRDKHEQALRHFDLGHALLKASKLSFADSMNDATNQQQDEPASLLTEAAAMLGIAAYLGLDMAQGALDEVLWLSSNREAPFPVFPCVYTGLILIDVGFVGDDTPRLSMEWYAIHSLLSKYMREVCLNAKSNNIEGCTRQKVITVRSQLAMYCNSNSSLTEAEEVLKSASQRELHTNSPWTCNTHHQSIHQIINSRGKDPSEAHTEQHEVTASGNTVLHSFTPSSSPTQLLFWNDLHANHINTAANSSRLENCVLTCSQMKDGRIEVNREQATALGVHWYDHSSRDKCSRTRHSFKMEPGCAGIGNNNQGRKQRQLLVTGVERSGTHFTADMLDRLGVNMVHEGLGPDGSVSWMFGRRAQYVHEYQVNAFMGLDSHKFCFVFHQVRHPLRVISAISKFGQSVYLWLYIKYAPEVCSDNVDCLVTMPVKLRSARLWYFWNLHIETYADVRFRIEDTSVRTLCHLAMFPPHICESDGRYHTTASDVIQPILEPTIVHQTSDGSSEQDNELVSWVELKALDEEVTANVQVMTTRYGYSLNPRDHPQMTSTRTFKSTHFLPKT